MSFDKAQVKIFTLQEHIDELVNDLEGLQQRSYSFSGGKEYLLEAKKQCLNIASYVKKDIDEGKIVDLQQGQREINRIKQCVGVIENLGLKCEIDSHIAVGRLDQLRRDIGKAQKRQQEEKNKARAIEEAKEEGFSEEDVQRGRRPLGVHPGESIKAQRNRELEFPEEEVDVQDLEEESDGQDSG